MASNRAVRVTVRRRNGASTSVTNVRIGTLPGRVRDYVLNGGRTVEKALAVAGLDPDSDSEVRVNGEVADMNTELREGDCLLLVGGIEGN